MDLNAAQKTLESARFWSLTVSAIAAVVPFIPIAFLVGLERAISLDFPLEFGFIAMVAAFILIGAIFAGYTSKCSNVLMPSVLDSVSDRLGSGFIYDADGHCDKYILEESGLVDTADEVDVSSRIEGPGRDGLGINMCNVSTYTVSRDKDGRKTRNLVDSGVFIEKTVDRASDVKIVVRDKTFFASKTMDIHGVRLEVVKNINARFEKDYQVYSNDPIKTLRFLSPSMIEKFMNLARIDRKVSEISVSNNRIYLFLNNAEIKAVGWLPLLQPDVHAMIGEATENLTQILDMVDLVCNEQRLERMDS